MGFLESGKTTFAKETLMDRGFTGGAKTLLLVCEDGEEEYALTAQAIEWKDSERLIRLKEVNVAFESNGGSAVEEQTVGAEQGYKAEKPADPVKEGFVFVGWKLADGTDFEFDSVLTEGVQLFAEWRIKPADPDSGSDPEEGRTGCGSAVSFPIALAALLAAVWKRAQAK